MDRRWDVVVVGGGGLQAAAMFDAANRAGHIGSWLAVDRAWRPERREAIEMLGVSIDEMDVCDEAALQDLLSSARLAANFAGPYYKSGTTVLDACIAAGTDYIDICGDADVTLQLLEREDAARSAGIRALVGMGFSPGVTNVLVRLAHDALGSAGTVDIAWTTDVSDMGGASIRDFWHVFQLVEPNGTRHPVQTWSELTRRTVRFPDPVGDRLVFEVAHAEPITIPRFLPIEEVTNFGGLAPDDALVVSWALARLGAADDEAVEVEGDAIPIPELAVALYDRYRERLADKPYLRGGLHLDVHSDGNGYRFSSADEASMEESTGTPAAAGIDLMLAGRVPSAGVFAPECLEPSEALPALGRVGRGRGSIAVHRLEDGQEVERLRLRDLLSVSEN